MSAIVLTSAEGYAAHVAYPGLSVVAQTRYVGLTQPWHVSAVAQRAKEEATPGLRILYKDIKT